jgi:hypothetical protein
MIFIIMKVTPNLNGVSVSNNNYHTMSVSQHQPTHSAPKGPWSEQVSSLIY